MTRPPQARADDGSILPLIAFYTALAVAVVLLVTAASSLYLERKRLFTLADEAALVGAESFDVAAVPLVEGRPRPTLRQHEVAGAIAEYLHGARTSRFHDLRVESATSADGRSATVVLSTFWRPPVVTLFAPEGIRIEVTAAARAVFR